MYSNIFKIREKIEKTYLKFVRNYGKTFCKNVKKVVKRNENLTYLNVRQ